MNAPALVNAPKPDLVDDLAGFAAGIDLAHLDPAVVQAVKTNVLDTLACGLAGSSAPAIAEVTGLVREWGGAPQADMFVFGGKFPAHHAAWANAGICHARDYDDTHDTAVLHAGVTAVPAAIAAGQLRGGLSGADLIAAIAAGIETTCRLGLATKLDLIESGFIYTSLFGYFGATAAAGRAFGLNETEMLNAFGIVYSSVAGNHQVTRDASLMKRLQPGYAAQAAIIAVQLAKRGIRGAQKVFEGEDGFFRVYLHGEVDPQVVRRELGARFELLDLGYKPYPCCRDLHTAVDAALAARAQAPRTGERHPIAPRRPDRAWLPDRLHPRTRASRAEDDRRGAVQRALRRRRSVDRRRSRHTQFLRRRSEPRGRAGIDRTHSAVCRRRPQRVEPGRDAGETDRPVPRRPDGRDPCRLSEGPPEEPDDRGRVCGEDQRLRHQQDQRNQ